MFSMLSIILHLLQHVIFEINTDYRLDKKNNNSKHDRALFLL